MISTSANDVNPCSFATCMWSSAVFLAQGYAVLHSMIVQLSFFTRGAIRSAFRYPLDHFSHVETLTPTFHVNSTHSFS
jgi:hypothetical protein